MGDGQPADLTAWNQALLNDTIGKTGNFLHKLSRQTLFKYC